MVPVVPLFSTEHSKGKHWLFNKNADIPDTNVMDKIWDRNPANWNVIGHCSWDKKTNDHTEPTSRMQKNPLPIYDLKS